MADSKGLLFRDNPCPSLAQSKDPAVAEGEAGRESGVKAGSSRTPYSDVSRRTPKVVVLSPPYHFPDVPCQTRISSLFSLTSRILALRMFALRG